MSDRQDGYSETKHALERFKNVQKKLDKNS